MTTNLLVEETEVQPPLKESLSDIVRAYSAPLPKTEWLTRLDLLAPRERLTCLPLSTRVSKRAVDIIGALTLLVLCAPVMLCSALLVLITSPGGIIYRQTRVGLNLRKSLQRDRRQDPAKLPPGLEERRGTGIDRRAQTNYGRPFTIYKFRSMRSDAEKGGATFAQKSDPRVTTIGRFLRRTRIDELPQLWNILKGDMSLVGPRPERPDFMEDFSEKIPNYLDRLGLKPGLTGIAQVVNGYDNDISGFKRKVQYDLLYLQNCCFTNDLKILMRTVRVVITGEGAL
ncbi:MAG: sugar transferase [Planctomycetaceae bacterium]|nr:sugar transferase [Planctomycetaceae bacterium]